MDRVNECRQIVQEFLGEFAQNDANAQLIFDGSPYLVGIIFTNL